MAQQKAAAVLDAVELRVVELEALLEEEKAGRREDAATAAANASEAAAQAQAEQVCCSGGHPCPSPLRSTDEPSVHPSVRLSSLSFTCVQCCAAERPLTNNVPVHRCSPPALAFLLLSVVMIRTSCVRS